MTKLPKLSVPKTILERLHDVISILILLLSFVYFAVKWAELPHTIAIHFNGSGEADGWGSKAILLLLPILSLVIFTLLSLLRKIPHQFNYIAKITEQNALHHYKNAIILLSWVKLEILLIFSYVQWSVIQNAVGKSIGIGSWLLPIAFLILLGTILYYVIKVRK
ncbi:DUF1648 domain-containing protein [Paenibacillus sinopodophylli]|uniref:DUF1648 domain-containing protein n=1 Tax=Paenibacillus sinopodophylli TaxID=1837342 RepID=UPI00110D06BB|nr:DUF1648 domain-containing protein [Paenibacillus sinopodophylli]